jgi:PKHD-type hydroxylase
MQTTKPPEPAALPNDFINVALTYESAFSPGECESLLALALGLPSQDGVLDSANRDVYRQVRKSAVRMIDFEPNIEWVFVKLRDLALNANQSYRFDIHGFRERLQVAEYGVGDHFDWHLDLTGGPSSLRKMSISVLLSDAASYEGGDLEFFRTPAGRLGRNRGAAIVFPSFMPHRVTPVTRGTRFSLVAWIAGPSFR